jgi:hypothetical protein
LSFVPEFFQLVLLLSHDPLQIRYAQRVIVLGIESSRTWAVTLWTLDFHALAVVYEVLPQLVDVHLRRMTLTVWALEGVLGQAVSLQVLVHFIVGEGQFSLFVFFLDCLCWRLWFGYPVFFLYQFLSDFFLVTWIISFFFLLGLFAPVLELEFVTSNVHELSVYLASGSHLLLAARALLEARQAAATKEHLALCALLDGRKRDSFAMATLENLKHLRSFDHLLWIKPELSGLLVIFEEGFDDFINFAQVYAVVLRLEHFVVVARIVVHFYELHFLK